jgi:UDP-N-acetylmuramate--alanine ligase
MHLQPVIAVVTNIDADHMDTYGGSIESLYDVFVEFLHNLPFYGLAVLCIDDPGVRAIADRVSRPVVTYGFSPDADVRGTEFSQDGQRSRLTVHGPAEGNRVDLQLNLPGKHNASNALAAVAVAWELEASNETIASALSGFGGIDRRMQVLGELKAGEGSALLVDDYGHHPRELEATIEALRAAWPDRRLVVVFQPHRYSRTRDLLDDFAGVLASVDALVLTEVYPAGEAPIAAADGRALARAIRSRGQVEPVFVEDVQDLPAVLPGVLRDGDLVVTLGAGSIGAVAAGLQDKMAQVVEPESQS